MSDIDLTAARNAARAAYEKAYFEGHSGAEARARAIDAALPHVEHQVRQQVARAIEAVDPIEWALAGTFAGANAARIVRGDS